MKKTQVQSCPILIIIILVKFNIAYLVSNEMFFCTLNEYVCYFLNYKDLEKNETDNTI